MSVINWGEVYYAVWRAQGEGVANEKLRQIAQLPIEVIEADVSTTKLAASLKAEHNLPYVDCFAAGLARQRKAILVTADQDFARLEAKVTILWARES